MTRLFDVEPVKGERWHRKTTGSIVRIDKVTDKGGVHYTHEPYTMLATCGAVSREEFLANFAPGTNADSL